MTVYVDDMYLDDMGRFGRMKMSHMLADTDEELHAMAARIGVARKWWQSPEKTSGSHYDIAMSRRELAISAGAVPITLRQASAMNLRRKLTGELGPPEEARAWVSARRASPGTPTDETPRAPATPILSPTQRTDAQLSMDFGA